MMLAGLAALLILAHLLLAWLRFAGGHASVWGLVPMFNLDEEQNVPTFFSSTLLLISACLLSVIARAQHWHNMKFALHWTILASVFFLLALDEASGIHELISFNIKRFYHTTGVFFYAWVIPGIGGRCRIRHILLAVLLATVFIHASTVCLGRVPIREWSLGVRIDGRTLL